MKGLQTIAAFERAVRAHEMMGAQRPELHQDIEDAYLKTRAKLVLLINHQLSAEELEEGDQQDYCAQMRRLDGKPK